MRAAERPQHLDLRTELDPDKFQIEHDVPVFDAHETDEPERDPKTGKIIGIKKVKYTKAVLQSMADNMNRRIEDTGDYTALCLGHTPTHEEKLMGLPQPPLVGFAGPYYVGTIGYKKPRPAIIAKNFAIFKDEVDRVRKHPRRSVEVWKEADPHDRYIEPIALLGAETPRRDLGLAYSRVHEGIQVERYTAMAPAANNTYIPGGAGNKRDRYVLPVVGAAARGVAGVASAPVKAAGEAGEATAAGAESAIPKIPAAGEEKPAKPAKITKIKSKTQASSPPPGKGKSKGGGGSGIAGALGAAAGVLGAVGSGVGQKERYEDDDDGEAEEDDAVTRNSLREAYDYQQGDDDPVERHGFDYGAANAAAAGGNGELSDQALNQIIAAISEMDAVKWAQQQMQSEQAKAPETVVDPAAMMGDPSQAGLDPAAMGGDPTMGEPMPGEMPENPDSEGVGDTGAPDMEQGSEPLNQDESMSNEPTGAPGQDEEEVQHYAADATGAVDRGTYDPELVARYAQIEAYNAKLIERLDNLENRNIQAERYAQIAEAKETYIFDEAAERDRATRYSKEQWEEHVTSVMPNYQRNPVNFQPLLPHGSVAKTGKPVDNKELYAKVRERAERYIESGKHLSWNEVEAEVRKELAG